MSKKDNKPAALDHALYEMLMLAHSIHPIFDKQKPSHVRSAWLEVFAIHARNLNEFFGAKSQWPDDMRPEDFVADWNHLYTFDPEIKSRSDKQVAHLTYERETPEEKTNWPVMRIFKNLREPSIAFLNAVRKQELLMKYNENLARTDELLNALPKFFQEVQDFETNANVAAVSMQVSTATSSTVRYLGPTQI